MCAYILWKRSVYMFTTVSVAGDQYGVVMLRGAVLYREKGCPRSLVCICLVAEPFALLSGWGRIREGYDFLVNFTMDNALLILSEYSDKRVGGNIDF